MYMDKLMDSGDIISQEALEILDNDNLDLIYEKMSYLGGNLLIKTLPSIINGTNKRIKQNEAEVTFGYNITKAEEKIDFSKNSKDIHNRIRGLSSVPGAYCFFDNKRLKVYQSEITENKSVSQPGEIIKIEVKGNKPNKGKIIVEQDNNLEVEYLKLNEYIYYKSNEEDNTYITEKEKLNTIESNGSYLLLYITAITNKTTIAIIVDIVTTNPKIIPILFNLNQQSPSMFQENQSCLKNY
jgi:uncharacterized membrane protein